MAKRKISEKAKSQAQQKAAGAALAAKRGEIPVGDLRGASKAMYNMSEKDLEDIAGTKHKGLPVKKESKINEADAKKDATWIYKEYIKGQKMPKSAMALAYEIRMDTDAKISPGWVQKILKKYYKINLPMKSVKESVNEASKKSVTKIAKELESLGKEMKKHAAEWKASKDEKEKAKHVGHLKALTAKKRGLEKEMDFAISGLDSEAELVANEHVLRGLIRKQVREHLKR